MERLRSFFNLIALLVKKAITFAGFIAPQKPSENTARQINDFVNDLIVRHFPKTNGDILSRLSITQQEIDAILDSLKDKNYYYFSAFLTELDKLLLSDTLFDLLKYNQFSGKGAKEYYFESLNENVDETDIIILPSIQTIETCNEKNGSVANRKAKLKTELEDSLINFCFVKKSELAGSKLVNLVLDCDLKKDNSITIAATPYCDMREEDLFNIVEFNAMQDDTEINLFSLELKNSTYINSVFQKILLKCAEEKDIDILLCPECLGTEEMAKTDRLGFNDMIRGMSDKTIPTIVIPPTFSHNSCNVLSVFNNSGEKLGEQHKQTQFEYHKSSKEDLRNAKKEIFILHVKKVGKICFSICKDFIYECNSNLIRKIRPNLILCPSYSRSASAFHAAIQEAVGYNCRVVWINCCSAFYNCKNEDAFIGLVAGHYMPKSLIQLKCNDCENCVNCIFKIEIPLNVATENRYVDRPIKVIRIVTDLIQKEKQ